MATVVLAPFYVTRPPFQPQWQGMGPDSNTLIRDLTTAKIFGAGGQVPTKFWRYDLVPQPDWVGTPLSSGAIRVTNTQVKFFGQPGQSPTKQWHYDHVPERIWSWEAPPALSLYLKATNPFSKLWRTDYQPDPVWLGQPIPANYLLKSIDPRLFEDRNFDYFNYVPDTCWTWEPPPTLQSTLYAPTGSPFSKEWRYDFEPDKIWSWAAPQNNNIFSSQISSAMPPMALWEYNHVPPTNWLGTPQSIPYALQNQPVAPNPFTPVFWNFNLVPQPNWSWKIPSAQSLYVPPIPTRPKFWRYDLDNSTSWTWEAPPSNSLYLPQLRPFSKLWRYDYVPETLWVGKPIGDILTTVATTRRPFSKLWRYDYIPQPDWVWKGTTREKFPPTVTFFGAQGQAPTKLWRYDHVPQPVWVGKPRTAFNVNTPFPPFVPPVVEDDGLREWPRRKIKLVKHTLPIYRGRIR